MLRTASAESGEVEAIGEEEMGDGRVLGEMGDGSCELRED